MKKGKLYKYRYLGAATLLFFIVIGLYELLKRNRAKKAVEAVEKAFPTTKLDDVQKDSITKISLAWDKYGDKDPNKFAYVLATAKWETNFRPIQEKRALPSQADVYALQERYWHTNFFGRGYIGLTWEGNYRKMSSYVGVDLVANPNLALDPGIAARILVQFMMNRIGKYSLHDFINSQKVDYYNARRVVNILDRAEIIQGYAIVIRKYL